MKAPFGKQPSGLRLERMPGSKRYRNGAFQNLYSIEADALVPEQDAPQGWPID